MPNRSTRRRHAHRSHRSHALNVPMPDICVGTFGEAVVEASALFAELGRAFVGYTLDGAGKVTGGWALTADHHRIEDVVLLVLAGATPLQGSGVLLFSTDPDGDVGTPDLEDGLRWCSFQRIFAARGYHLWDWIHADGDAFRSMHLASTTEEEWPAPPVGSLPPR